MGFLLLGLALTALKLLGIGVFAGWSWWLVLAPYALAAAWWIFSDATGITQRNAMRREQERAERRREEQYERLGLRTGPRGRGRAGSGSNSKWNNL